ncbi:hypothetical protein PCI56_05400 [Plesiomonas shigelloides subsp. oncorhynchi]|nr:hypothetical protein [Plesiomonas shigelloides]
MLVGLMVATPAAFASDFVTGVIMGQLLSDDSGSKKVNNSDPESKTVIEYHDGQPIVTKMEVLKITNGASWMVLREAILFALVNTVAIREGNVVVSMRMALVVLWER